jgi:hypothetical protein
MPLSPRTATPRPRSLPIYRLGEADPRLSRVEASTSRAATRERLDGISAKNNQPQNAARGTWL